MARTVIPAKVRFTGMEFDPDTARDRCHRGPIPAEWGRYRFTVQAHVRHPVTQLNRWLFDNIEGKWVIWSRPRQNMREVSIAFEHDHDGVTFVLADGRTQAFKED